MIFVVLLILGFCFGSFVNALVWRLHEGKDWINDRSECPSCHHQLASKDLIPVISWVWLRGKCRYCHKPIPDSPLVELAMPILFVVSFLSWHRQIHGAIAVVEFAIWLVSIIIFMALLVYDLKWFILPDKMTFSLIALGALWVLMETIGTRSWHAAAGSGVGIIMISGLFLAIYKISRGEWIGFGDVKLGVALGIFAGGAIQACMLLFFASLLGLLVSLPLVAMGKANRKTQLPFGPLLITGAILVQLYGSQIIDAYTRFWGL